MIVNDMNKIYNPTPLSLSLSPHQKTKKRVGGGEWKFSKKNKGVPDPTPQLNFFFFK